MKLSVIAKPSQNCKGGSQIKTTELKPEQSSHGAALGNENVNKSRLEKTATLGVDDCGNKKESEKSLRVKEVSEE